MKCKVFALLTLLFVALPVGAAVFQAGDEYSLLEGEILREDLYVTGGSIVAAGDIAGDVIAAGGKILIKGTVSADVVAVGGNVDVLGAVNDDVRVAGGQVVIGGPIAGDLLVAGGQVHVLSDVVIQGDVVAAGGRIVIDGDIRGGARVFGGDAVLNGTVSGDVRVFADNQFAVGNEARIGGNLTYRAPKELERAEEVVSGEAVFELHAVRFDKSLINAVLGAAFLLKVMMLLVAGLLVVVFFGQFSHDLGHYAVPHFGKSLLLGFVLLIIVPIMSFLLFASVIGLVVGALSVLIYGAAFVIAKVYAGVLAGAVLARFIRKEAIIDWRWAIIGIVVLQLVGLAPVIGWAIGLIFTLAAFGATSIFAYERLWLTR